MVDEICVLMFANVNVTLRVVERNVDVVDAARIMRL
jgi:hypothetical protein